jgi:hypothetical protein
MGGSGKVDRYRGQLCPHYSLKLLTMGRGVVRLGKYFFLCFSLVFTGCNNIFFPIRLKDERRYAQIQLLMGEIYQKARDGDTDYFWAVVEREYDYDEQIELYQARYGDAYDREGYDELYDREVTQVCEDLMGQIVKAKINKTYKKRAFWASGGINFDYHLEDDKKGIHFQIYLKKDQTGELVLDSLFKCR